MDPGIMGGKNADGVKKTMREFIRCAASYLKTAEVTPTPDAVQELALAMFRQIYDQSMMEQEHKHAIELALLRKKK